jgi:serine/threonine protein kinase
VEDNSCAAISMDKYEGQSLAETLKNKGALDPQEIQPWIAQLAETLSDAHRIQLIHRDLAPDNLIVRTNGNILVTSFGLARSMRDAMERAGLAKGEASHLSYMSPQQIDGERPVPADDVYGLGALIFELLTGRPPFVGNELVPQIRKAHPPAINALRTEQGKSAVPDSWHPARFLPSIRAPVASQVFKRHKDHSRQISLFPALEYGDRRLERW